MRPWKWVVILAARTWLRVRRPSSILRSKAASVRLAEVMKTDSSSATRALACSTPAGVGAHNSVVGADQGFRAPSGDQESVRDSVHEDSASALWVPENGVVAGQAARRRVRTLQGPESHP